MTFSKNRRLSTMWCEDGVQEAHDQPTVEEDVDYSDVDEEEDCYHSYVIGGQVDFSEEEEENITQISTVFSISKEAACVLLRHYNWNVREVYEEWFAEEERVRYAVGVLEKPMVKCVAAEETAYDISFDDDSHETLRSAGCAHLFCDTCGKVHISTSINEGTGCLMLRCLDPSYDAAVGQDMIDELATNEDKEKNHSFPFISYVGDSCKIKWCLAPGCDYVVKYGFGCNNYATRSCLHDLCGNCAQEAHRPVDCKTVAKWLMETSEESENLKWILANSKPCPKCKIPIEKNEGCLHMTCRPPCKFQFCWECLGAWSDHGRSTGGFFSCRHYEAGMKEGKDDEAERRSGMTENYLERCAHYHYKMWATNERLRQQALADLLRIQSIYLSEVQYRPKLQLKFISIAFQEIAEWSRVLKWTYVYGYYLPKNKQTEKRFFKYWLGEAETQLKELRQCAERALEKYHRYDGPSKYTKELCAELINLISRNTTFFENLVRVVENGLINPTKQAPEANAATCQAKARRETAPSLL
ncbi:IBR domain-containing protein [Perilla frutescens var. frutescens]|nr:IBR domain-containing protein [Perilla frutescens var. frutescens]